MQFTNHLERMQVPNLKSSVKIPVTSNHKMSRGSRKQSLELTLDHDGHRAWHPFCLERLQLLFQGGAVNFGAPVTEGHRWYSKGSSSCGALAAEQGLCRLFL